MTKSRLRLWRRQHRVILPTFKWWTSWVLTPPIWALVILSHIFTGWTVGVFGLIAVALLAVQLALLGYQLLAWHSQEVYRKALRHISDLEEELGIVPPRPSDWVLGEGWTKNRPLGQGYQPTGPRFDPLLIITPGQPASGVQPPVQEDDRRFLDSDGLEDWRAVSERIERVVKSWRTGGKP